MMPPEWTGIVGCLVDASETRKLLAFAWACFGAWIGLQAGVLAGLWIATPRRSPDGVVELAKRRKAQRWHQAKAGAPTLPPAPPNARSGEVSPRFRTILPTPR